MKYLALVLLGLLMLPVVWAQGEQPVNLISDGTFATDADKDDLADGWSFASGADPKLMDVTFGREELSPGHFAQRMSCTRFDGGGHVMLAQTGTVAVQEGQWYRLTLRARGENLAGVQVALRDTNGWQECGLSRGVPLSKVWRTHEYKFQATRTCQQTSRFQIWYTGTGTLWVSDVSLTQMQSASPENVIAQDGCKNLLPNAGFEVMGGWGVANYWTYGWQVAAGAGVGGSNCAAVKWLPENPDQRYMFDYFDPINRPLERPSLQPIGYLPLTQDATYTLSAYLKADMDSAPGVVGFAGPGGAGETRVRLTKDWQRVVVRCKATGPLTAVMAGPDMREADARAFGGCTVFVDNVQLEQAEAPTDFVAKPLEAFLRPEEMQFVASPAAATLSATADILSAQACAAALELTVTDTEDKPVATVRRDRALHAGSDEATFSVKVPGPGFYRLRLTVKAGERVVQAAARRAVCLSSPATEASAFGINHAYAYNGMVRLVKRLGVTWMRDWTLKWEHVEPTRGEYKWRLPDEQIGRALGLDMNVLCMFPFPSAEWSSSAAPELKTNQYPGNRIRQSYAPTDIPAMQRYMAACVERYKKNVHTWEIFNESIDTDYSLPKAAGYKPEQYVPLLSAAYDACKQADPTCQVIGGYSAPPGSMHLWEPMFKNGGLSKCDLVSLHVYPATSPEYLQKDLDRLNAAMDANGGRKPTWFTEYAYYADDDPDPIKYSWPGLVESELQQAAWNTRACTIMLANGVRKIFYHIWTGSLNKDIGATIFFEYGGQPHKIAPTQAALNYFLGPEPKFIARAALDDEVAFGYVFAAPPQVAKTTGAAWVGVIWAPYDPVPMTPEAKWKCYDMCGTLLTGRQLSVGEQPVYICAAGSSGEALAKAIAQKLGGK